MFRENALRFYREEEILPCLKSTASFDMGDLSLFMPVLHGITSASRAACTLRITASWTRRTRHHAHEDHGLHADRPAGRRRVPGEGKRGQFRPVMSKEEYLQYLVDTQQHHYGNMQ